jgi:hypothetical protein
LRRIVRSHATLTTWSARTAARVCILTPHQYPFAVHHADHVQWDTSAETARAGLRRCVATAVRRVIARMTAPTSV